MRKKAFTLTEMLICLMILMMLMSGISVLIRSDSSEDIAKQDMDRLARWLNHALARADRWKQGFLLRVYMNQGDDGRFIHLVWDDSDDQLPEIFYADSRVLWTYNADSQDIRYNWATHSVSPAFSMKAVLDGGRKETDETLTLSVRGLVTREQSRNW